MELLKKYTPKSSSDIIGNKIQIKKLKELLKPPQIIGLLGPNGCGKTLILNLLFSELNYDVLEVYNKDTLNIINSFLSNRTIDSFVCKKTKAVLVDNIDVLSSTDKISLTILDECYKKYNKTLIVITGNFSNEKQLTETFKKNIEIIKVNYPCIRDSYIYISDLLTKESVEYDDEKLLDITTRHRGSIRDIMINMHQTQNELSIVKIDNTFKDYNNFEITKAMFLKPHSYDEVRHLDDINVISFMIYENFPEEIYNNYSTKFATLYIDLNRYFVTSNIYEQFMYKTMNWGIYDMMQHLKLMGYNHIISNLTKKKTRKDLKYRFSQLLSKLSHKNIMNKKIEAIKDTNMNMSYTDILCISDNICKKKEKYGKEEMNFINTYEKYFN